MSGARPGPTAAHPGPTAIGARAGDGAARDPVPRGRRSRPLVVELVALAVVILVAASAFAGQWQRPQARTGTADSYWYLRAADRYAGADDARAAREASDVYCAQLQRAHRLGAARTACTQYDVRGVPARYRAIFDSRPGLPLATAPLVAVAGLARGMAVATGAIFVLVALAGYGALRLSRVGRVGSVLGAAAVCLLPLGFWDSRMLAEGAAHAGLLVAVAAAVRLLRGPAWVPAAVLALALSGVFVTKPAQAAALGLALVAAATLVLVARQPSGTPGRAGWAAVAGTAAAVGGGWWSLSTVRHLPTLTEAVQDLATRHFRTPDIAHPLPYLLHRAAALWWHLPRVLALPWPLVVVLAAGAVVLWCRRGAGLVWVAAALSDVLVVSAHPLRSEYPRLISTAWLVVAAAIAMGYDVVAVRYRQRGGRPGKPADGRSPGHPLGFAPDRMPSTGRN